jgi:hypothetical protein
MYIKFENTMYFQTWRVLLLPMCGTGLIPLNYLTTTALNFTSTLLPCSYIAKQVIQNVLLYKSGRRLATCQTTPIVSLE